MNDPPPIGGGTTLLARFGKVCLWPFRDLTTAEVSVRVRGHMLALSSSQFDPERT